MYHLKIFVRLSIYLAISKNHSRHHFHRNVLTRTRLFFLSNCVDLWTYYRLLRCYVIKDRRCYTNTIYQLVEKDLCRGYIVVTEEHVSHSYVYIHVSYISCITLDTPFVKETTRFLCTAMTHAISRVVLATSCNKNETSPACASILSQSAQRLLDL